MAMNASARAQSMYQAVETLDDNFEVLNTDEKDRLLRALTYIFGDDGAGHGDLVYIHANADVLPSAHSGPNLNNPPGQHLSVPALGILDHDGGACTGEADTGVTSIEQDIEGMGRIV